MKTTANVGYYVSLSPFLSSEIILDMTLKRLKFPLGIKSLSSRYYWWIFKSIFVFWNILEHDLKKCWNFCLVWKPHQAGHITKLFYCIFDFWEVLQHDLQKVWNFSFIWKNFSFWKNLERNLTKRWNFCLVSKLHQPGDIT